MKKIIALLLSCVLLLGLVSAHAEEAGKYDRLTVGVTTPFTGNFLDDVLGSNICDQDVRMLIHGYSLVEWDQEKGSYEFSKPQVTTATASSDNLTYTFAITDNMKYNDGTPITARDYAFTLLLLGSPELKEAAGARGDISRIKGGSDYQNGTAKELAGFKLVGDYEFERQAVAPQGNRGRRYMTEPGEAFQVDWGFADVLDSSGHTLFRYFMILIS